MALDRTADALVPTDTGMPAPVLSLALYARFMSRRESGTLSRSLKNRSVPRAGSREARSRNDDEA